MNAAKPPESTTAQPVDDPTAARQLAERVAAAMLERDGASRLLGMEIRAADAGYARVAMVVREDMVNGHCSCHGGLIFALADSAFAFACNSDNQVTVGSACNIDYLAPAFAGDTLIAEARHAAVAGRNGVYDVAVSNQNDELIALFRGKSRRVRGRVL